MVFLSFFMIYIYIFGQVDGNAGWEKKLLVLKDALLQKAPAFGVFMS